MSEAPDIGVVGPLESLLVDLVIRDPLQDFLEDDARVSSRARAAPRQECMPKPNAM